MPTIRLELPHHLRNLIGATTHETTIEVEAPITLTRTLDALEARYPQLRGTIRDHVTQQRRPFLRFFANEQDITHQSPDAELPTTVLNATEPLIILGAIAGG
ncbi:MAG: MoaD/ThiS family protein [Acidobacteriota bacterium]